MYNVNLCVINQHLVKFNLKIEVEIVVDVNTAQVNFLLVEEITTTSAITLISATNWNDFLDTIKLQVGTRAFNKFMAELDTF